MNVYRIITFDGFYSREITLTATDIVNAIMLAGVNQAHVIKAELIGSDNKE